MQKGLEGKLIETIRPQGFASTVLLWIAHPKQMWVTMALKRRYHHLFKIAQQFDAFPADIKAFHEGVLEAGSVVSVVSLRFDLRELIGKQFLVWWCQHRRNDELWGDLADPEGGLICW